MLGVLFVLSACGRNLQADTCDDASADTSVTPHGPYTTVLTDLNLVLATSTFGSSDPAKGAVTDKGYWARIGSTLVLYSQTADKWYTATVGAGDKIAADGCATLANADSDKVLIALAQIVNAAASYTGALDTTAAKTLGNTFTTWYLVDTAATKVYVHVGSDLYEVAGVAGDGAVTGSGPLTDVADVFPILGKYLKNSGTYAGDARIKYSSGDDVILHDAASGATYAGKLDANGLDASAKLEVTDFTAAGPFHPTGGSGTAAISAQELKVGSAEFVAFNVDGELLAAPLTGKVLGTVVTASTASSDGAKVAVAIAFDKLVLGTAGAPTKWKWVAGTPNKILINVGSGSPVTWIGTIGASADVIASIVKPDATTDYTAAVCDAAVQALGSAVLTSYGLNTVTCADDSSTGDGDGEIPAGPDDDDTTSSKGSSGLGAGAIAGIVIAAVVVVAAVAFVVYWFVFRKGPVGGADGAPAGEGAADAPATAE